MENRENQTDTVEISTQQFESLPEIDFLYAGIRRHGKVWREKGLFFLQNADGSYSTMVRENSVQELEEAGTADEAGSPGREGRQKAGNRKRRKVPKEDTETPPASQEESGLSEKPEPEIRKPTGRKWIAVAAAAVLLLAAAAWGLWRGGTEEMQTERHTVAVLMVREPVLPGEEICADCLEETEIGEDLLLFAKRSGDEPILSRNREKALGHCAAQYIPAGRYLTPNQLRPMPAPAVNNEWMQQPGETVVIPLSEEIAGSENLIFGTLLHISVRIVDADGESETVLSGIPIADLRNRRGESLFDWYAAAAAIPDGEREAYFTFCREKDASFPEDRLPVSALIRVSTQQKQLLGTACNRPDALYEVELTGEPDRETEDRLAFHDDAKELLGQLLALRRQYGS